MTTNNESNPIDVTQAAATEAAEAVQAGATEAVETAAEATEAAAEAVQDAAADVKAKVEATIADAKATATEAAAGISPTNDVLSAHESNVLSDVATQLRDLLAKAGLTEESVAKFSGDVRTALEKGVETVKENDFVEDAIEDTQEFIQGLNRKLNKWANDAVAAWNKAIADEDAEEAAKGDDD